MQPELRVSRNLFVIPDGDRFILYEPQKPSALSVNGATVQLLANFKNNSPDDSREASDIINTLISYGIIVSPRDDRAISFPNGRRRFDPQGLSLFLTAACSMRCIYCYAKGGDT